VIVFFRNRAETRATRRQEWRSGIRIRRIGGNVRGGRDAEITGLRVALVDEIRLLSGLR